MFDREAAERVLYTISKVQFTRFLSHVDCDDLYGLGYFCDPLEGVMLVANTRSSHDAGLREFIERFGPTDEEAYRWDIGNWKYPGGLAVSSTEEQMEFDAAWEGLGRPISGAGDEDDQECLEVLCIRVLTRLCDDGVFWAARNLEGFVVLGPDDSDLDVLVKKRHLDRVLHPRA
jgi:hypothetical protein